MSLQEHLKELNQLHKSLRTALTTGDGEEEAIHLFFALHSQLHSRLVSPNTPWSYEDLLLERLDEAEFRKIPERQEHSLAWIVWHLSRVEDVTMNCLVAGCQQIFERGGWQEKIRSPIKHTGNGTGLDVVGALSAVVDINALRAYRVAVGVATQEIVQSLTLFDFKRKVSSEDVQRILKEGAVLPAGKDVVDYWRRRDVAGLLLMPPTRHTIVHWNEARKIQDLLKAK